MELGISEEDILKMKNKNKALQEYKKEYHNRDIQKIIRFTQYEWKLLKKKIRKSGKKEADFFRESILKEVVDEYDEDKVNMWRRLGDDYVNNYDNKSIYDLQH